MFHANKNHLKEQHLIQQNERYLKAMNDYHKEVEPYLKHLRESFAEIDEQAERLKNNLRNCENQLIYFEQKMKEHGEMM